MRLFFHDTLRSNENPQAILELKKNDQNILKQLEQKKNALDNYLNPPKMKPQLTNIRRGFYINNANAKMDSIISSKNQKKNYINPLYEFFFNYLIYKTWKRYSYEKLHKFEDFASEDDE